MQTLNVDNRTQQSDVETPQEMLVRWEAEGRASADCRGCEPYYQAVKEGKLPADVFQPRHKAMKYCESGHHNHCSCDICF